MLRKVVLTYFVVLPAFTGKTEDCSYFIQDNFLPSSRLPQYHHDGSETLEDQFMVRGVAGDKESVPAVVRVLVTPVNDEPPHIANNTGLILWEGSTAIITSTHLGELFHQSLITLPFCMGVKLGLLH
jgi:hypothetical protein